MIKTNRNTFKPSIVKCTVDAADHSHFWVANRLLWSKCINIAKVGPRCAASAIWKRLFSIGNSEMSKSYVLCCAAQQAQSVKFVWYAIINKLNVSMRIPLTTQSVECGEEALVQVQSSQTSNNKCVHVQIARVTRSHWNVCFGLTSSPWAWASPCPCFDLPRFWFDVWPYVYDVLHGWRWPVRR